MNPAKRLRHQDFQNTTHLSTRIPHRCALVPSLKKVFIIFTPLLFICLFFSCAPESCFEETNAFVKVLFYKSATGKRVAPDSLTLYGLNMENRLYNKTTSVQPALLPLNAGSDNCTFIMKINGITDTMFIPYSTFPHLISRECGYAFYHTIDTPTVTNHAIITHKLVNKNITTINEENIRIYY